MIADLTGAINIGKADYRDSLYFSKSRLKKGEKNGNSQSSSHKQRGLLFSDNEPQLGAEIRMIYLLPQLDLL